MVSVPTIVHVEPLAEMDPVQLPAILRSIFTQYGATIPAESVFKLVAPVPGRRWKEAPEPGVTTIIACEESGLSVSRIITPALAQTFVLSTLWTLAIIEPAPVSILYAKWNSSASTPLTFQISAPELVIVKVPAGPST